MKVKFITCIYSDLHGTEIGGRPSRGTHYRHSLLSLLKMTDAHFVCYTSDREYDELKKFFHENNGISEEQLSIKQYDISKTKFQDYIDKYKDVTSIKNGDRCLEIQFQKFNWWLEEDGSYDYYYWIDAGLSHTGLIQVKYMGKNGYYSQNFDSPLFNNLFLSNLVKESKDKFFIIAKNNQNYFWSHTVDSKWYTEYDSSWHVIGGLFGGHKDLWKNMVSMFEDYTKKVFDYEKKTYFEENIMSLMFANHKELFSPVFFDHWWCRDNAPGSVGDDYFINYKGFNKVLENLNDIYE
jgi:hypothetical protein